MKVKDSIRIINILTVIGILILLILCASLYASSPVNVEVEFSYNKRGDSIYRLHNYEYETVDCYISGNYEYFDSFEIKKRSATSWMYTPSGINWECY